MPKSDGEEILRSWLNDAKRTLTTEQWNSVIDNFTQEENGLPLYLKLCFEEVKFDEFGRVANPNLAEYKIPTALDVPTINPVVIESNEPAGPYGAKEVGEGGIMPAIPAIINAVFDATGVRFRELPLNPERVLLALKEKRETGKVSFDSDERCSRIVALLEARRSESE